MGHRAHSGPRAREVLSGEGELTGRRRCGAILFGQNFSYLADGVNRTPCQEANAPIAFVRSVNDRYVFLCDTFFGFAPSSASLLLIHELLHVAGQLEDLNGAAGPNNPPSSDAIQDEVENACTSPADVGDGY